MYIICTVLVALSWLDAEAWIGQTREKQGMNERERGMRWRKWSCMSAVLRRRNHALVRHKSRPRNVRLAVFTCLTVLVPYALCASSVLVVASSCLLD